jgi:CO/xanthine dehydrogenase FAD-binding subunit
MRWPKRSARRHSEAAENIAKRKKTFVAPRIALGAVAPVVIHAAKAEAYLEGRATTLEAMAEAGRIAAGDAKPISDFRASAGYRRDMIEVLSRRALEGAYALAQAKRKKT